MFQIWIERYFEPLLRQTPDKRINSFFNFGIGLGASYFIVTILIFNLHDYVTVFLNSDDICNNDYFYEIISWILPRASSHCDMLLMPEVYYNPHKGIVLILDFLIFIVFLTQTFLGLNFALMSYRKRKNQLVKILREHRMLSIIFVLIMSVSPPIVFHMAIFDDSLVPEPGERHPYLHMLSGDYGIGTAILTATVGIFSFLGNGGALYAYFLFFKSFSKK